MNKYMKMFIMRGLTFGGFGPIVTAIVYAIVGAVTKENMITTFDFFLATITTYILAFVVAGCSMIYGIENWSIAKASLVHVSLLYISYLLVYVVNSWIPFSWIGMLVFTGIFIVGYFVIWLSIYISLKAQANKLNEKVKDVFLDKKQ